jgi:hypothetical protein
MKTCKTCKEFKSLDSFRIASDNRDGRQGECKECKKKKKAEWHAQNPGLWAAQSKAQRLKDVAKANAATKKWRDANPDKVKALFIGKRYGLTLERWNEMFAYQEGKCAICGTHQDQLKLELAVDHCHKTGKVRGLLCVRCNRAIGLMEDNPELLHSAIVHLTKL